MQSRRRLERVFLAALFPLASLVACSASPGVEDDVVGTSQAALSGVGELRSQSGRCLEAQGSIGDAKGAIAADTCANRAAQRWQLTSQGDLRGMGNRCVTAISGDKVELAACKGTAAQRFAIDGDRLKNGSKCLTLLANDAIGLSACGTGAAQKWSRNNFDADPAPAPSTCSASDVAARPGTTLERACRGGFEYRQYKTPCYAEETSTAKCGRTRVGPAKRCTTYETCEHEEFGRIGYDDKTLTVTSECPKRQRYVCPPPPRPPIGHEVDPVPRESEAGCVFEDYYDCPNGCQSAGHRARLSEVRKHTGGNDWPATTYSTEILRYNANHTAQCEIKIVNIPVFRKEAKAPCDVELVYDCAIYLPNRCRPEAPHTGTLDTDKGACGIDAPVVRSGADISLRDLRALDPSASVDDARYAAPRCVTCDDLPAGTAAEIGKKAACLKAFIDVEGATPAEARAISELKLLFELNEAALSAELQAYALELYKTSPSAAQTCHLAWDKPSDTTCDAEEKKLANAALDLCAQAGVPEVAATARAPYVAYCLDAPRAYPGISNCEDYDLAYEAIMDKIYAALDASVRSGREADRAPMEQVRARRRLR